MFNVAANRQKVIMEDINKLSQYLCPNMGASILFE